MADDDDIHQDHGSAWVRLRSWLREQKEELTKTVMGAGCSHEQYLSLSARAKQIDLSLARMDDIAHNRDRPQRRERIRLPEESDEGY